MKKSYFFLISLLLISAMSFAQSPLYIPYQGIIRSSTAEAPIPNKHMSARLTVRNSTATGSIAYQESDTFTTSALGLISLNIGQGTVLAGTLSINWGDSSEYLQVEIDTTGGTSYVNMGAAQQLMSVPYAMYAATSGVSNQAAYSILGNDTSVSAAPTYFTPALASPLFRNQGTNQQFDARGKLVITH